jgi:uncharacterized membrane protein YfcA
VITIIVLTATAFLGGALNALAGGGSLVTFPALLFAGLNPIVANASSVVALFPATFTSAWAYRRSVFDVTEVSVTKLAVVSLVGGLVGALLLLWTPTSVFAALVPWLVLFATIIFAVGNFAPLDVIRRLKIGPRGALLVHFVISVYGGYFGGGIGFLMLAALTFFGLRDIHAMNGLKILLASVMNGAAVVAFIAAGAVRWPETLVIAAGAVAGGYVGVIGAKRVPQAALKAVVLAIGMALTIYFFVRGV